MNDIHIGSSLDKESLEMVSNLIMEILNTDNKDDVKKVALNVFGEIAISSGKSHNEFKDCELSPYGTRQEDTIVEKAREF